jgi:hypothetical protein
VGLVTGSANFSCDLLSLSLSGFSSYRICELVVSLKGFLSAPALELPPVRNTKTRNVTLEQSGYLCPRCDGFSLCFGATGMID